LKSRKLFQIVMNFSEVRIVLGENYDRNPRCFHGPTLLFERKTQNSIKKFYACSAYRDRKDCSFYHDFDVKITQKLLSKWSFKVKETCNVRNIFDISSVRKTLKASLESCPQYCLNCDMPKFEEFSKCQSEGHELRSISSIEMSKPCSLLNAKSANKKEAQYFFSSEALDYFNDLIYKKKYSNVLSIGCPSIFENLPLEVRKNSLLLDIDHRFSYFYEPTEFIWYNFFNNYFFNGASSQKIFQEFLINCDKLLIILDPPFGAKSELIAICLKRIVEELFSFNISVEVNILWVFPYYMEKQVLESMEDMKMSDFKVTYKNHTKFGDSDGGRKLGSPIRFFTDVPLRDLPFPAMDGYRYCEYCHHWVAKENLHCKICQTCPSKDGRTYVHCALCARCVKPTYLHCSSCGRCKLKEHLCTNQSKGGGERNLLEQKPNPVNSKKRKKLKNQKFKNKRRKC